MSAHVEALENLSVRIVRPVVFREVCGQRSIYFFREMHADAVPLDGLKPGDLLDVGDAVWRVVHLLGEETMVAEVPAEATLVRALRAWQEAGAGVRSAVIRSREAAGA
jgi:hypothetical protein